MSKVSAATKDMDLLNHTARNLAKQYKPVVVTHCPTPESGVLLFKSDTQRLLMQEALRGKTTTNFPTEAFPIQYGGRDIAALEVNVNIAKAIGDIVGAKAFIQPKESIARNQLMENPLVVETVNAQFNAQGQAR